ncbi:hypothetical protein Fcan01_07948 [Folsomia candida]|uniref:Uncharacterized protein n=1 Tax=Folsomia candida TaxID=158441 RepID=A0A226ENW5_FOLCA|nr:hypothetical protein Fcan01_07948 [Folsomia candida]
MSLRQSQNGSSNALVCFFDYFRVTTMLYTVHKPSNAKVPSDSAPELICGRSRPESRLFPVRKRSLFDYTTFHVVYMFLPVRVVMEMALSFVTSLLENLEKVENRYLRERKLESIDAFIVELLDRV